MFNEGPRIVLFNIWWLFDSFFRHFMICRTSEEIENVCHLCCPLQNASFLRLRIALGGGESEENCPVMISVENMTVRQNIRNDRMTVELILRPQGIP